jgi:hypothetical protein
MNKYLILVALLSLTGCNHSIKIQNKPDTQNSVFKNRLIDSAGPSARHYTDGQLEAFLDSIGHLPTQALTDKGTFEADSVFKSLKQLDTVISPRDFETLKRAARKGVMRVDTARRIFKNRNISYDCTTKSIFVTYKTGLISVVYIPFNKQKNAFNEFALYIGDPGHCESSALYFFKRNKIIALHDGYNRFASEMQYYKDADGKTVVYYGKNFGEGSGVDFNYYYFYKYDGDRLIPILDEVETANLQPPAFRARWLESSIVSTHPLTIKMVYNENFNHTISLPDTTYGRSSSNITDDSTVVRYAWDANSKTLKGDYDHSKLTKAQVMSYYGGNDYLFINAYYKLLKDMLKDKKQRNWVLWYLEKVKTGN